VRELAFRLPYFPADDSGYVLVPPPDSVAGCGQVLTDPPTVPFAGDSSYSSTATIPLPVPDTLCIALWLQSRSVATRRSALFLLRNVAIRRMNNTLDTLTIGSAAKLSVPDDPLPDTVTAPLAPAVGDPGQPPLTLSLASGARGRSGTFELTVRIAGVYVVEVFDVLGRRQASIVNRHFDVGVHSLTYLPSTEVRRERLCFVSAHGAGFRSTLLYIPTLTSSPD